MAIVPVKGFARAKTRLVLPAAQRAGVAEALASRTLAVLRAAESVDEVLVVSDDFCVRALAESYGCRFLGETAPGSGLNAAVRDATRAVATMVGSAETLVIVADLPTLDSAAVDLTVQAFRAAATAMFVADRDGTGTTAVYRPEGDLRGTRFGPHSAYRHRRAGYRAADRAERGLRTDLDLPTDISDPTLPVSLRRLMQGSDDTHFPRDHHT